MLTAGLRDRENGVAKRGSVSRLALVQFGFSRQLLIGLGIAGLLRRPVWALATLGRNFEWPEDDESREAWKLMSAENGPLFYIGFKPA